MLGVHPVLGRALTAADDRRGEGLDGPVAVISYAFWQRHFAGAADVIGRSITLDRLSFTIVGVAPPEFFGTEVGQAFDVVVPLADEALVQGAESALDKRGYRWLNVVLRLKPGQTIDTGTTALRSVQPQVREATMPTDWPANYLAEYLKEPFTLQPATGGASFLRDRYQRPLTTLMVVVILVLLIAYVNIANLLLARASSRRQELAVRLALGASRLRVAMLLFAESLLLAGTGAVLGFVFAQWGSRLLVRLISTESLEVRLELALDWRVLLFTIGVTLVTALLFGTLPAFRAARVEPQRALVDRGRTVVGTSRLGLAGSLVVVQVALSMLLVVAGALFVRTFTSLATLGTGFDSKPLLLATVDSMNVGVNEDARLPLYERIREAVAAVPGVAGAATSVVTPVSGMTWQYTVDVVGAPPLSERERGVYVNHVSLNWFRTYGMQLRAGRDIAETDSATASLVAVVNETFVRQRLRAGNAVGRMLRESYIVPDKPARSWQIVGVVSHAVYRSLREPVPPTIYIPLAQVEEPPTPVRFTVRSAGPSPSRLVRDVARAIAGVNPELSILLRPLEEQVSASLVQERLIATLSGFFGVLGLLLAGLGLYGLASYTVTRRRAEIGVRIALGAEPWAVVRGVALRLTVLVAAGVIIGGAVSLWAARFVAKLLFGLQADDIPTLVTAAALLVAVAIAASWVPARRAARIDPAEVLRET